MTDENELVALRAAVRARLSEKRYKHTLGVETAAARLAQAFLPEKENDLRAAALLHDIAKELPTEEQLRLIDEGHADVSPAERNMTAILHAYAAPAVILRDFPTFATEEILRAVACHTAGREDMTVFDKIIFIADYTEDGRTYPSCVSVREKLARDIKNGEGLCALDMAVLSSVDETVLSLIGRSSLISEKTILTRNAVLTKLFLS